GGPPGIWTPLSNTILTEGTVVATVEAPSTPGRHSVELDLVHGELGWLGRPVHADIDVARRVRVGILVRDATCDHARDIAETIVPPRPELEPVFVGIPSDGYAGVPGPEARVTAGLAAGDRKLRSFVTAARRARADDTLEVDALVLGGLDATTL